MQQVENDAGSRCADRMPDRHCTAIDVQFLFVQRAERARHDPAQFCDVDYREFVADPIATVAGIYGHFGLELTEDARTAMVDMHDESRRGPRAPKHEYSLADYGLTVEQVRERFAQL